MDILDDANAKQIDLNRSQALIQLINANVCFCVWPRAGGKTTGGIGPRVLNLSEKMPRSQCLLVADSFERISKVLWPAIENFLSEELGMVPDVDFVVHKKPPEQFIKPYFIPAKYDHVISFSSGFCLCEVSLEVSGSGNGYNAQAVIGDEIKYWDEKKFKSEVRPAIRGGKKLWGNIPEFQSMWFFTDKFPSKGADLTWVLNKKAEVNHEAVNIIYTLQLESLRLQQVVKAIDDEITQKTLEEKYEECAVLEKQKTSNKKKIDDYEERMRKRRMDLIYYSDALPYENIEQLGEKYFRDLRRDLTKYEYDIAIENKDPDKAMKPFYPDLNDEHYYESKVDCNPNVPLIIALDYQYMISPVVVAQYDQLPDSAYKTLNFIRSLHTLYPHGIADAIKLFCETFEHYPSRHVMYVFDSTAIGRSPHGKTFMDLVHDNLILHGWTYTDIFTGDTPDHDDKYQRFKYWFAVKTEQAIRINKIYNADMITALEKTSAKTVNGKNQKDKSSEKENSPVPAQHATHYSDTWDQIVWAGNEMQMIPLSDFTGMDIRIGSK